MARKRMCEGVQRNNITFSFLLSACSNAARVDERICYYASMVKDDKISEIGTSYLHGRPFFALQAIYKL
jgi:hypothetical protein